MFIIRTCTMSNKAIIVGMFAAHVSTQLYMHEQCLFVSKYMQVPRTRDIYAAENNVGNRLDYVGIISTPFNSVMIFLQQYYMFFVFRSAKVRARRKRCAKLCWGASGSGAATKETGMKTYKITSGESSTSRSVNNKHAVKQQLGAPGLGPGNVRISERAARIMDGMTNQAS